MLPSVVGFTSPICLRISIKFSIFCTTQYAVMKFKKCQENSERLKPNGPNLAHVSISEADSWGE